MRTFSPSLRLLSDHLAWQLGALTLEPSLHEAAEFVIGNLDEDGYLAGSEEELAAGLQQDPEDAAPERPEPDEAATLELVAPRHRTGAAA